MGARLWFGPIVPLSCLATLSLAGVRRLSFDSAAPSGGPERGSVQTVFIRQLVVDVVVVVVVVCI